MNKPKKKKWKNKGLLIHDYEDNLVGELCSHCRNIHITNDFLNLVNSEGKEIRMCYACLLQQIKEGKYKIIPDYNPSKRKDK